MESGSFGITIVLCSEVVLFSECPLSEVPSVNHNNAGIPPYQLPHILAQPFSPALQLTTTPSHPHSPHSRHHTCATPPSWTHNGGSPGPPVHRSALPGVDRIVTQEQVNRILKTKHVKMKHHTKTNNKQNK